MKIASDRFSATESRRHPLVLAAIFLHNPRRYRDSALAWLSAMIQLRRCTSVGRLPRVWGRVRVYSGGQVRLEDRIRIQATPWATELAALPGGVLSIGSGTFINSGVSIAARRLVTIGRDCQIGPRVLIMDNDFHTVGEAGRLPPSEPVVLEDEVWVGAGAIILKGVRIGRGATIGAGSVVTRDVAPGGVVAGVPARPLRPASRQAP